MNKWRCKCLFLMCFLMDWPALAAPIPVTSSSFVISNQIGKFISERGFSIHAEKTDWIHSASPPDNPNIAALYRSKTTHKGVQAGLTIRVDDLQIKQSLKNYVKQWLKDYPRFGFDILNSKPIRINSQRAFLLDMINRQTSRQLRQVVFLKNKTAVILTCRDHRESFKSALSTCNEIISNFRWDS